MKHQTPEDEKRIAETIAKAKKPPVLKPIPNYEKKQSDWCAQCEGER